MLSGYTCQDCRATNSHAGGNAKLAATPAPHAVCTSGKAVLEVFPSDCVRLKTVTIKADHVYLFDLRLPG